VPRPWKRPDLPPGPLGELNRALHGLHHRAGWPSSREIQRSLEDKGVPMSHTKVHDTLTKPDLPTKGAAEMITEVLAETIRGADVEAEVARLLRLWENAALGDQSWGSAPASPENHTVTAPPPPQELPPAKKKDKGKQPPDQRDTSQPKRKKSRTMSPKGGPTEPEKKPPAVTGHEKSEVEGATLVIGNLGPARLEVFVEGALVGTTATGEHGLFPVEAGKRAVQVGSGGRRSAARRIVFKRGGSVRVAFDMGVGSDAGPEPVEQVAFTGGRERKAILMGSMAGAPLLLTGMVVIPNSTEPVGEQLAGVVAVVLFFAAIGGLMGAFSPDRLNLSGRELEFGAGSHLQSIHWSELAQVSLVGEGSDTRLVVWPRKDHELRLKPPPLKDFQGGKVVCKAADISADDFQRLYAALRWFAQERWVEQLTRT